MSENVVINGETYENIDAIAVENESGETILFGAGETPLTGVMMAADYDPDNDKIFGISVGGTGASTAEEARQNLGLGNVATKDIIPIEEGGTGGTTRLEAIKNLLSLGSNPVVANDSPSDWIALGSGYAYFNSDSEVINKPFSFGLMVQEVLGTIVIQRWYSQSSGDSFYRQGNVNGWNGSASVTGEAAWKRMLDGTNGFQKTVIWESEDTVNPFEPEKILVNLSSYDEVEIEFKYGTSNNGFDRVTLRKGSAGRMFAFMNIINDIPLILCSRLATVYNDGIIFDNCYAKNVGTSAVSVENGYVLPFRIYGIRGIK